LGVSSLTGPLTTSGLFSLGATMAPVYLFRRVRLPGCCGDSARALGPCWTTAHDPSEIRARVLDREPKCPPDLYSLARETSARSPAAIARAAAGVRSITRPRTNGPLSLIVTTTDLPFFRFVTRTRDPHGRDLWAAV